MITQLDEYSISNSLYKYIRQPIHDSIYYSISSVVLTPVMDSVYIPGSDSAYISKNSISRTIQKKVNK